MSRSKLITMYNLEVFIGIAEDPDTGEWTYAPLDDGIDNVAEALNEVVQQYQFLSDNGFAQNHVTGMAPAFTFTGRRVLGDEAQEYIFSKKYKLDRERWSKLKLTYTDAQEQTVTLVADCTICNMQEFGGASTDDAAISFEVRFDGQPTVTVA